MELVGSKARQHWLWCAYNTKNGGVLAYTFGPRTDETCRELLSLLTPFTVGMVTSDGWGSYAREVPKDKRLARKTICFSRSVKIHEKVIGSFF
ncbi:hypothetical protein L465_03630 [Enterobacter sp. BIDMC 29]|nr:hypothetical protein L465_03630 [Enterobacter sp. BIDMC 29]